MKIRSAFCLLALFISIGMAAEGQPGEFATTYFMTADDANSGYFNPALFILIDRPEATLSNTFLFEGSDIMYLNFSYPIRRVATVAVSSMLLYTGGIESSDEFGNYNGDTYGWLKMMLMGSYAHQVLDMLAVGGNVKIITNRGASLETGTLESEGAYGGGIDIGATYSPIKELYVGLGILNVAQFWFNDSEIKDKWPMTMKLSLDYLALNDKLEIGLNTDLQDVLGSGGGQLPVALRYEMEYYLREWFSLVTAIDDQEFGFGLTYQGKNLLKFGEEMKINYHAGYNYRAQVVTNRLALTTRWGLSRKEKEIKRLGKLRKMAPINAFEEAMRLFHKRQYWDAGYVFGTVVSLYPEYEKVDLAKFYIAECFFNLGMEGAAETLYRMVMEEYPNFVKMPDCLSRLQNMHYRRGEYDNVVQIYNVLKEKFPSSAGMNYANYLMGQINYKKGAMAEAVAFYGSIPAGTPEYKFAQYALALSYLHLGDNDKIVEHFTKATVDPPINKVDEEVMNKAHATLGHFYFELFDYPKAVASYQKVGASSQAYDDALIGWAWSLVNQRKYTEAVDVLNRLVKSVPNSIHVNEADLVKGYCYTLLKEYERADVEFASVTERCKAELEKIKLDKAEIPKLLSDKEIEVTGAKQIFADLEKQIFNSVIKKPSQKRDSDKAGFLTDVRDKQDELANIKNSYAVLKENIRKVDNYERILQNAEYAAATAKHLKKEEEKKAQDKEYEKQIKKLEQEMQDKLKKLEGGQ